jgi:hypothetical protein
MSPRLQNQVAKSKEQALAAFVSKKAEIDTMLTRLQALSDDHFGYSPDEIDWGHAEGFTTPSCSSASPTKPSTKASTPSSRSTISRPRPDRVCPAGLGVVGGRWCSPTTEIIL